MSADGANLVPPLPIDQFQSEKVGRLKKFLANFLRFKELFILLFLGDKKNEIEQDTFKATNSRRATSCS